MSPRHRPTKEYFWGLRPFRRHSLVLVVAGLAYVSIGNTYILTVPTDSRKQALVIALSWFPIEFWGTIWILVGIAAILSARWPPAAERWGYVMLTALSAGWSATYLTGIVFAHSPAANIYSVIVWALVAFLWWAIGGLVNPMDTVVVIKNGELGPDS